MRILTITNWYPPHHFGGYELSCRDVMGRLVGRGHDVHVLCADTVVAGAEPADPDHERRVTRSLRLYHSGEELLRPSWPDRLRIERHNQRALADALERHRPDVVSVWQLAGASFGLLAPLVEAGVPLVLSVCDDWLVYGRSLDPWSSAFDGSPPRRAAGRLVRAATGVPAVVPDPSPTAAVLHVSAAVRDRAHAEGRWALGREAVVHSGIDRTDFPTLPPSDRPWRGRLVVSGRFDPRKGFETALRALPLLDGATLDCFGRGGDAERRRLERLAGELGVADQVRFGSLARAEVAAAYAGADAVLFPSTWAEPFGLVPVEAMACATPVVATGVGGSAEFLVDGGNCLLVAPGDPEALAGAVRRLAGDPALRRRLVAGGSATADQLDVDRLTDVMERWHQHAAGGFVGPQPGGTALPVPAPVPPRPSRSGIEHALRRLRRRWRGDRRPLPAR